MDLDFRSIAFLFLGGLGIFLFGIKYMSEGLSKTAGDRLRGILEKATDHPVKGVIAGALVTTLLQTSSGSTVMMIGLVNAGLLSFRRAIPMLMGANLGTTTTAFLISFKIGDYSLPIIAAGALLIFFFKKKKYNHIGQVIFGFGMIFLGLDTMSKGLSPFRSEPSFIDMMATLGEIPLLGVLAGTVFTVLVQSSSAAIAVLQTMAADGLVTLDQALPILFGDNIGTTITAVLASIGATVAARRTALVHVMFNVLGTIMFMLILPLVKISVVYLASVFGGDITRQIAYAHMLFNSVNVVFQLPLIGLYIWLIPRIVKGDEVIVDQRPIHLQAELLQQPTFALEKVRLEVKRMGHLAIDSVHHATNMFLKSDPNEGELSKQKEEAINNLNREVVDYLVRIARKSLTKDQSKLHSQLMHNIIDIERIGDHAENLMELAEFGIEKKVKFSPKAHEELTQMIDLTTQAVNTALEALDNEDAELAMKVFEIERKIDKIEDSNRKMHIERLNLGECTGPAGMIYLDMISNLERIGDHSANIADSIVQAIKNKEPDFGENKNS